MSEFLEETAFPEPPQAEYILRMDANTVDVFNDRRYVLLSDLLDKKTCEELTELLKTEIAERGWTDAQCPKSSALRDSQTFDQLLLDLLPHFEQATGLTLLPTYAYARLYEPGEVLKIHQDREACEISASVTLGLEGDVWPIYLGTPSAEPTDCGRVDRHDTMVYAKDVGEFTMDVGDAVLYRGCELYHWRDEYSEGTWQAQVFLHYVDANGPYRDWIYDKRDGLSVLPLGEESDLTWWTYTDVLSSKGCDLLVSQYSTAPDEEAGVGEPDRSRVDKTIRNVNRVILPVHKGIGARLAAVGLDANAHRWKFDIVRADQSEFLKYPAGGGRYTGHMDTMLTNKPDNLRECRKLTVLAFLNDNFKGGRFFFQLGSEKVYPPQAKGTVLVFPSFLVHGVEDVEEGERYSVLTWMVGPWFR
jgi:predicted 2-oxoglutarate/Fe(II)-dependent dioxygenase YbiX